MAHREFDTDEVTNWIRAAAQPFDGSSPDAPLPDTLIDRIGDAVVVGLGTATRAAHEVAVLAHRVLRELVERKGFRALALLDDETVVAALDAYVRVESEIRRHCCAMPGYRGAPPKPSRSWNGRARSIALTRTIRCDCSA